jgi:hypothetical protein
MNYYKDLLEAYKNLIRQLTDENDLNKAKVRNLELSNTELSTRVKSFEERSRSLLKMTEINEIDRTKLNETFSNIKNKKFNLAAIDFAAAGEYAFISYVS